jgi:hypothetical protein
MDTRIAQFEYRHVVSGMVNLGHHPAALRSGPLSADYSRLCQGAYYCPILKHKWMHRIKLTAG